jgi:hypothetical protein
MSLPCCVHPHLIGLVPHMGFLSRLLIPRSVRRAMHPGRAVKRAVTPKAVKKARRAMHPIDNVQYSIERSIATSLRSGRKTWAKMGRAQVYRHGNCPVNHRTPEAAAHCRNN